jgi:hypothetical protein
MNKVKQFLALTGSALIITSYQQINNESDNALNNLATGAVVDTVPKKSDTIPTRPSDTTGKPDTTTMGVTDTTAMGRTDTTSLPYVDLRTGQPVDLYYDPKTRRTYSSMTNEPVEFYVDVATGDTIYGRGRYVVNNYIVKSNDGMYRLDAAKVKIDKDNIKIKDGTKKFKMDKSNMKMKGAGEKMKMDTTSGKMKTNDMKKKMDNEKSKTKSY